MVKPVILEKLEALPESMQAEVLHYIEFLLEKHLKSAGDTLHELRQDLANSTEEEAEKRYGYGSLADQITMSDDFDEPLDDLVEYM
ncbi:hypothetical protein XM38_048330 [Halomicronema hongdechloris C2206]|uniref:DUF2281 domain-containing protein n=1 Tax=Halomicronema hongdechloris C2206 TaxID=1641165 RepID=A0A1Z3HU87_9CYAN|nr:DUF2281 domain-containing protein [Halomicronema hongdechloris]ASC73859.1 hypothetical protein XM38_048330 [Halomicronema hongdechloris C2206]